MKTNTNNVNKTWAILKTTGGKDIPNIVFMHKDQQSYKLKDHIFMSCGSLSNVSLLR